MKSGMIFIDGMNLSYDWNTITNDRLDIELYISLLKDKFPNIEIKRTYYFATKSETNDGFLKKINRIPYCEVKPGRLQSKQIKLDPYFVDCKGCSKLKQTIETKVDKGTDVNIAVEMLKHAYNNGYEVAILVSRDADFSSVVRIVKDLGKTVELVLLENMKNSAKELTANVDNVTILSKEECAKCKMDDIEQQTSIEELEDIE